MKLESMGLGLRCYEGGPLQEWNFQWRLLYSLVEYLAPFGPILPHFALCVVGKESSNSYSYTRDKPPRRKCDANKRGASQAMSSITNLSRRLLPLNKAEGTKSLP
jgi:hypothetical protein